MKVITVALLALALAACSPAQQPGTGNGSVSAASVGLAPIPPPAATAATPAAATTVTAPAADGASVLAEYHWRLTAATDASGRRIDALLARPAKPLQLDFDNHDVAIGNTCNRMHGNWSLAGGKLTIGNLASTLMACRDAALTALDAAAARHLEGTFAVGLDTRGAQPELVLTDSLGDRLTFGGSPTAVTRYGGKGETVFLEIAPRDQPCPAPSATGTGCLEVRELRYNAQGLRGGEPGPWHVLPQAIEGYAHRPGTRNVLRVTRYRVANPPAGASSTAWVLDMVVETERPAHSR